MTYRIFTNDRGKQKGVYKYSALIDIEAPDAKEAQSLADKHARESGVSRRARASKGYRMAGYFP